MFISFIRPLKYGGRFFVELLDTQFVRWGSHCHRNAVTYLFLRKSAVGLFYILQRRTFKHILNIPQLGEIVHIIWMLERWRKNDDDDDDDDDDNDLDHMSNDV